MIDEVQHDRHAHELELVPCERSLKHYPVSLVAWPKFGRCYQ